MKSAQHWIDRLEDVSTERDQINWVKAIQRDAEKTPVKKVRREIQAAEDMLKRIHGICDDAGIPRDDGDRPYLVVFCEGHRVKLLAERLAAVSNAPAEPSRNEDAQKTK